MDGQISLFDFLKEQEEPQVVTDYATQVFFKDGYSETREYNKPEYGMWDDLIAKHGMIIDFRQIRGGLKNPSLKCPCMRMCDVEWCSLSCFLRRGYMRHDGKWLRNDKGEILKSNKKECDWTPKGE